MSAATWGIKLSLKPDTPTPQDPSVVAAAQTSSNKDTAIANANLNRVDTTTPYGDLTYSNAGTNADGTPKTTANVSLSPDEQQLLDTGNANKISLANTASGMLGQINQQYQQPANFDTTISPEIKQAQDAAYKSQTQYLDPQFARAQDEQNTRLANQGVVQGSDAYNKANDQLAEQKQRAYQSAQNSAVSAGNTEQGNLFNQMFSLRELPLNEFSALTTGSQVTNPNFPNVPTTNMANTNVAGIDQNSYQEQLDASQIQNSFMNNLFSLGGGLGSAAILASDRRLKRDIAYLGKTPRGFKAYSFRFIDPKYGEGLHIGAMADEVREIMPEAITTGDDGYMRVNYGMIS